MAQTITADEIREMRNGYGLSRKSLSMLLGIGEASIARYEHGVAPSKANANLLCAAKSSRFMRQCLMRDGDAIPPAQRRKAESYVYAHIELDQTNGYEGGAMDVNTLYDFVLRQEVLNEQAANIINRIIRFQISQNRGLTKDDPLTILLLQLSEFKANITNKENRSEKRLNEIQGYLWFAEEHVRRLTSADEEIRTAS